MASTSEHILLHNVGTTRIIELNRPAALNSLNMDMVRTMTSALLEWEASPTCSCVIIKGCRTPAGKPVFCAGGDVVSIVRQQEAGVSMEEAGEFFRREYALNHLIGTFGKPIVSLLDGVTSTLLIFGCLPVSFIPLFSSGWRNGYFGAWNV